MNFWFTICEIKFKSDYSQLQKKILYTIDTKMFNYWRASILMTKILKGNLLKHPEKVHQKLIEYQKFENDYERIYELKI